MPSWLEHPVELVAQSLDALDVVLLVDAEVDRPVGVDGDPVVGLRQVLAAEPEVDGVVRQHLERAGPVRRWPAHRGAWARISSSSDLPSIWMPPSGKSQSSAPRYQSFIASVFWNRVGLGSCETAIRATLLCRM